MKKLCFLCVVLSFFSAEIYSQDATFLNTNQSLIFLNPSFAGSNGGIRDQLVYRDESRRANVVSFYNGLDGYVKALHGGLALTLSDQNTNGGMLRSTSTNLIYAPRFKCSESGLTIIPSIQATYIKRSYDAYNTSFGSLINWSQKPQTLPTKAEKQNIDVSAGLLVNYKRLYAGVSVFHMNQPDIGLNGTTKLSAKYSANLSYNLVAAKYLQINFQALYQRQGRFNRIQTGVNALFFKHVIVGAGVSMDDKQYLNIGYRHNFFSLLFSYDETPVYNLGAYEMCASFNLRNKDNRRLVTNFESW